MLVAADKVIEVFATNVKRGNDATLLCDRLQKRFPGSKVNFDLHDKDKVLRIEGIELSTTVIITIVKDSGFRCAYLE